MSTIINNYIEGDYNVTEYGNGAVVRSLISQPVSEPEPIPIIPQPTNAEIQENQIVLMDVIATMYEEMLAKGLV